MGASIGRNGDGVVGPRRRVFGGEVGDGGRHPEDARGLAFVEDDGVGGERVDFDTRLEAVEAPPDEAFAGLGHGNGVVGASFDASDFLAGERLDDSGSKDDGIFLARAFEDAGFAEAVEAPSPDSAGFVDSKGVVRATVDVSDFVAGKAKFARSESVHAGAFNDATTELVLLAGAPSEDGAFLVKSQGVIVATDDVSDLLESRDEKRSALDVRSSTEPQNALVAL